MRKENENTTRGGWKIAPAAAALILPRGYRRAIYVRFAKNTTDTWLIVPALAGRTCIILRIGEKISFARGVALFSFEVYEYWLGRIRDVLSSIKKITEEEILLYRLGWAWDCIKWNYLFFLIECDRVNS